MNQIRLHRFTRHFILPFAFFLYACGTASNEKATSPASDSLTEAAKHLPENALKGLLLAPGLEVQVMASEPVLKNPTNIDVDARGRIWVTEAYNYRPKINGNPVNPMGDRIMILEDADGDGKIEKSKVFYQGTDLNAPMGICVLGNRVLVSQSPYVWSFWDDNGDDSADRKEILFQGIGGEQHDHGMHTFSAGADGKLYFNFGNEGKQLKDKNGKSVLDQDGDAIGPQKYKQGMVFRCNPDGSNVECLGSNFRNNYEVAADSYGTMWQSDNDDDGNRGVRINYVMEYGNYGYTDEMTGAGWQTQRTGIEDSVYEQHWHLNDPGTIPNLLQTGAGSPTGMVVYEGTLLPKEFWGQMIHCDPGVNVVRSYPVTKNGAGYKATIKNIMHDDDDQWFRPVDVCVAPDGSLIVADWYDPGVGGHGAGDQDKGRIYRIAPKGAKYTVQQLNLATPDGAMAALENPNLATRYLAAEALKKSGAEAMPALEALWHSGKEPRLRARALWLLAKGPSGEKYIAEAIADPNPDLRMVALRAARETKGDVVKAIAALVRDGDEQVRRECALALHHSKAPQAAALWATLAAQYKGDRWQLEALGIGADGQWDAFFTYFSKAYPGLLQTAVGNDLVWRSRGAATLPLLSRLATDSLVALKNRLRYFRAFDFHTSPKKATELLAIIANNKSNNLDLNVLALHHLSPKEISKSAIAQKAMKTVLQQTYGTPAYLGLVRQYSTKTESPKLLQLALEKYTEPESAEAIRLLIEFGNEKLLRQALAAPDTTAVTHLLIALGKVGYTETLNLLQDVALSEKYNASHRAKAAEVMGQSYGGEDRVIDLLRDKLMPAHLMPVAVAGMKAGPRSGMYKKGLTYLPGGANQGGEKQPPSIATLMALNGDAKNGALLFNQNCAVCHQVGGQGANFGPKLTEIGSKLPREALYKAIISPSSAISFAYETSQIVLKNGTLVTGIVSSRTEDEMELKYPGGTAQKIAIRDIKNIKELPESLMPAFYETLSPEELASVVAYLSTLTKK